jgi:glycosyltransferase involved in cell wall biosynthesis
MKANLMHPATGKGPFHGHEIQLTIGMIVKNEEEVLDRCLSSLQPLLQAIPSELIITDTGSTDGTLEIARKYTDRILSFEWCNDFSAARNTGLDAARGEWFMFIDADEWFEDISELIAFFSSKECEKYCSASYVIRSFTSLDEKRYVDTQAYRIFLNYNQLRFRGLIHEDIPIEKPICLLDALASHSGYVFQTQDEMAAKNNRNMQLLEEAIRRDPENLKNYFQLSSQYYANQRIEEAIDACKEGLKHVALHPGTLWGRSLTHNLARSYMTLSNYEGALCAIEESLRTDPEETVYHLEFYRLAQMSAHWMKQLERSVEYGGRYVELYPKYAAGELDRSLMMFSVFTELKPERREETVMVLARDSLQLKQPTAAANYLRKLDLSVPGTWNPEDYSQIWFDTADVGEDWTVAAEGYQRLLEHGDAGFLLLYRRFAEEIMRNYPEKRSSVVFAFAQLPKEEEYVQVNRLRAVSDRGDHAEARRILNWFAESAKNWNEWLYDVLYYTMRENMDLTPLLAKLDRDDLPQYAANLQNYHADFDNVVEMYFRSVSLEGLKGIFWTVCLEERAILVRKEREEENLAGLFAEYAKRVAHYVRAVYRPELFEPDSLPALPRAHRFGWYMGEAFSAEKMGDAASYLKNLRLALAAYPIMEKPISLLLEQFKKNEEQKRAKALEFQALAEKVKEQISGLIGAGRMEEAGQVTSQLAALMPNDPDMMRFRKLTHTELTMREIAAILPQ